jgi:hypothetical protein
MELCSMQRGPHHCVYGTVVLAIVSLITTAAVAQPTISAPMVREASVPKTSVSEDTRALMLAAPVQVWSEGQPIKVKQDLKGHGDLTQTEYRPAKQLDPLLSTSRTALEAAPSSAALAAPTVGANFDGIGATGVLPPDTIGAVGPNHYIQMVNSAFAIYDKSGNLLAGPSQINSLWQGFAGGCETDNDGDPVVRYDHLADRWLVSQFAIDKSLQCIAISRGADPITSGWFLYAFQTRDSNNNLVTPDYPKIGVWPDGYYMSTQRGFPNSGLDVWVFERDRMLAGQPARQVQFSVGAPSIVLQPSDLDGPPPPAGTPNFFLRQVDGQRFTGDDRIEVFAFSVNWANPAASTFQSIASLPTAVFDSVLCSADLMGSCVPQPGTPARLETLSVWPMFRAQYRNFGTHETLLLNHSVDATGQDLAGVRWYELRRPPNGTWSIFQQGTHAPDSLNRWMGSLAMDAAGNIMVGYSVANAQTSPGIRIAYRRSTDPAGTLRPETTIVNGGGSQTFASAPRWGDYGSMEVDPSQPDTFWYTTLYYATTSQAGWRTRIAEVRLPADESRWAGAIWRHTGVACSGQSCPGWRRLDNNIKTVDIVAGNDKLYQLHLDGGIWRSTGEECSGDSCPGWTRLDNNKKTLAIAAGGNNLYQLHNDGRIWKSTGAACSGGSCPGWRMLDNNPATQAIAASGDKLYQLHRDGRIWEWTGQNCSGQSCPGWRLLDNNPRTVAIRATDGKLFQLHYDGRIWRYNGTACSGQSCPGWQLLDNNPRTVDLSANIGKLYQRHRGGEIWRSTGKACSGNSCPGWKRLDNNPRTTMIDGAVYQNHHDGRIWKSTGTACSGNSCPGWVMLDNNPRTKFSRAADGDNNRLYQLHAPKLYQLHNNGSIWQSTGGACSGDSCPHWQRLDNNPRTKAIAASGGRLFQLHQDGKIWRADGRPCVNDSCPGWQLLDNNPHTVKIVSAGGQLYQLHNNGQVWRFTGTVCSGSSCPSWVRLDNNPATDDIGAGAGQLYQKHKNGKIWRFTGRPCQGNSCPGWVMLDNNPRTKKIVAAGGLLYQLHSDGKIWESTGVPCSGNSCPGWRMLDNNPRTVEIFAGGRELYQLHSDGKIWESTGVPCSGNSCPGWRMLDNNPRTKSLTAAGGLLYQLHNNGAIWRSDGRACSGASCAGWVRLDNNTRSIAIVAAEE